MFSLILFIKLGIWTLIFSNGNISPIVPVQPNKISFKEFLDKPEPYYVVDAEYEYHNDEVEQTITDVLEEQSTGWYYSASSFYAFENPKDCDLVKGVLEWDKLEPLAKTSWFMRFFRWLTLLVMALLLIYQ